MIRKDQIMQVTRRAAKAKETIKPPPPDVNAADNAVVAMLEAAAWKAAHAGQSECRVQLPDLKPRTLDVIQSALADLNPVLSDGTITLSWES